MKKTIKLSQWAKNNNYSYRGAFGAYQRGKIPGAFKLPSGSIVVEVDDGVKPKVEHTVIYARVSSFKYKNELDSQVEKVSLFCNAKGWVIKEIIKEYTSDLEDNRPKLISIFQKRKATRIVVENKNEITHFGFNFIQTLYPECEIVVINESVSSLSENNQ